MHAVARLAVVALLAFGLNLVAFDSADARRFGGARNMGKQSGSLFSRSATKPRTPAQQAASSRNQQARQQLAGRGGMMGMLGGLALGGLLGALFFGGAFENLNFLDLLVFGGIAWLAFKLLSARRRASPTDGPAGATGAGMLRDGASQDPGRQSGAPLPVFGASNTVAGGADADFDDAAQADAERPAGFDEEAFLDGARRAFALLQQSWNEHDLAEIRGLTTDPMFAALQDQMNEPDADAFVQVLEVDAKLLDVREVGSTQEASVLFDAILRESAQGKPAQVRELWHFTRSAGSLAPRWLLEGIEQLES